MGRLDTAGRHFLLIAQVHAVDELPIPGFLGIKIMSEGPADKGVDHIAAAEEELEVEVLEQQRQDILSPDSLEALARAVPVFVKLFISLESAIVAIAIRELPPEFMNDFECFGP